MKRWPSLPSACNICLCGNAGNGHHADIDFSLFFQLPFSLSLSLATGSCVVKALSLSLGMDPFYPPSVSVVLLLPPPSFVLVCYECQFACRVCVCVIPVLCPSSMSFPGPRRPAPGFPKKNRTSARVARPSLVGAQPNRRDE